MHPYEKHVARDKHLLRLERELNRLLRAQWHAPIIPLEHPYQRGWVKIQIFKLVHDSWLMEDIQPNLITHQRVDLPEVRRRIAEIEAHLTHTNGRYRLHNLHGQRNRYWVWRTPPRPRAHTIVHQMEKCE